MSGAPALPGIVLSPAERELLKAQRVARMGTVNADGTPHVVPICFADDTSSLYTTLPRGVRRLVNVTRGSPVAFLVDGYEERGGEWTVLCGVQLYGLAEVLDYRKQPRAFMRGWRLLIAKYPQYRRWADADLAPTDPDRRRIVRFIPRRKVSWGLADG